MLSLIMEERLNTFLEVTKSLSHNQMGFKRRSGTREATLALYEIIKQASKERPVLTAFIDVRAAYDSVIREVLYAKMLKMGIGGRFLTTIQGMFHSMEAELEVGGAMIGLVKMELGLAQGSPLSPVLFNIYINSCITELERLAHAKATTLGVSHLDSKCRQPRMTHLIGWLAYGSLMIVRWSRRILVACNGLLIRW